MQNGWAIKKTTPLQLRTREMIVRSIERTGFTVSSQPSQTMNAQSIESLDRLGRDTVCNGSNGHYFSRSRRVRKKENLLDFAKIGQRRKQARSGVSAALPRRNRILLKQVLEGFPGEQL